LQARAPLMIEHRLIERMINIINRALKLVEQTQVIDPLFVDLAVDFMRTYADRVDTVNYTDGSTNKKIRKGISLPSSSRSNNSSRRVHSPALCQMVIVVPSNLVNVKLTSSL